jgi:hypothetical protein
MLANEANILVVIYGADVSDAYTPRAVRVSLA